MSAGEMFNGQIELKSIPNSALQAIYHAVTGKTENLSKVFNGDVIVKSEDIDSLYGRIVNQIEHYVPASVQPDGMDYMATTTVIVKGGGGKATTYSSWEKFKTLKVDNSDITSEINIKVEFLVHLTNTPQPQRCVVNIAIDSALPVMAGRLGQGWSDEILDMLFILRSDWRTVEVSIEFVDFILAKNFINIVNEWFDGLEKTDVSKLNLFILKNFGVVRSVFGQIGKVGLAIFMLAYLVYESKFYVSNVEAIRLFSISIFIIAIFESSKGYFLNLFFKRVASNIVSSVIILTKRDESLFDKIRKDRKSTGKTIILFILAASFNLALNLLASYIYAKLE